MNTWKVILATLVIFVAGVITGGLVVGLAEQAMQHPKRFWPFWLQATHGQNNAPGSREPARLQGLPNPVPRVLRKDFLQKLDREVHLSADQHERIEKIIKEGQERTRQLSEPIAPLMREELTKVREGIRSILTPEQFARFEGLVKPKMQEARRPQSPQAGSPTQGAPPSPSDEPPRNP